MFAETTSNQLLTQWPESGPPDGLERRSARYPALLSAICGAVIAAIFSKRYSCGQKARRNKAEMKKRRRARLRLTQLGLSGKGGARVRVMRGKGNLLWFVAALLLQCGIAASTYID